MSWDEFVAWLGESQSELIGSGLRVAGVLVGAFLVSRLLRKAVTRVEQKVSKDTTPVRAMQRTATLTKVVSSAGIAVTWAIAAFLVLDELNFNLAPLLAGVGIIGLAVGFGAQNLVRDVVTGFFILLEDQYGVGDILTINQVASGRVEQLTLRVTGLRDLDGTMHFIANGNITHVSNRSKDWARAVVDVGVGYGEDSTHVRAVLERVATAAKEEADLGRLLYAPPQILGVENLGEYEVMWRLIADTKPGRQFDAGRMLRERIKLAFDGENIEIPFPHRVMISADAVGKNGGRAE